MLSGQFSDQASVRHKLHCFEIFTSHRREQEAKYFRDGLSYSTPQKNKETRGNAITQPRSHPIPKFYIVLMGWDRGWVMAFPLFLHCLRGGV